MLKDHFRDANRVKAKAESSIYYGMWLKATGASPETSADASSSTDRVGETSTRTGL
jgi:hypothetical protein